ncbi:C45 family autoproteolytic acyltransferase/hydolase [Aquimarina sp. 2201CG14-23]|uniref:C45 family autoproteolytic acyltransferase/hydolase n=1 Tax=Aquimarina mycalae TaxID=3040073 RepID=UPI002477D0B5|nr:C45 family peptidase [Aquimarina sp. 2201CG14-23]MDH7446726.1 C45 family autoproteolytic acyltransferase/hydrolase [Aquimarina sp. 2201CG14-23]
MRNSIYHILFLTLVILSSSCGVKKSLAARPDISGIERIDTTRVQHSENFYTLNGNLLRKNTQGLWELYLEGKPLERGIAAGSLARELIKIQEDAFIGKVTELIPSKSYLKFLSKIVAWYNRKLHLNVPEEYKAEIYGVSRYASNDYNDFAEPYVRMLYAHGAHDIGHALQDLMLVGCTSFAAWGDKTEDGQLLIGRNFDFYAGDEFSKEKLVTFMNPEKGHKFMTYGWAGMIGALSGMNEKGLTVTINAGKSKIPLIAKTPISILTREILQYAATIDEAIEIAKKREVFVSESIMIGSAKDKKAVLIEVSPNNFGVYDVPNTDQLICSNHFQSESYKDDKRNLKAIAESHSFYRYQRMTELLSEHNILNPKKAVEILRNREGLKDKLIGYGNEKALNQMLAHHGIVFQPESRKVWVSTNPYQMGEFVAYDLDEVFSKMKIQKEEVVIASESLNIPEDTFIHTEKYMNYESFRVLSRKIENAVDDEQKISEEELKQFENLNPNYWATYFVLGKYYYVQKDFKKALTAFKQAKKREVTTIPDMKQIEKYIRKCERKI